MENITWLGHASFLLENSLIVYIDPWKIKSKKPADIILISHNHSDHLSLEDIKKIRKPDTIILGPKSCQDKIPSLQIIEPGKKQMVKGIEIRGISAYNINKTYHYKEMKFLGFVITTKTNKRIYYAGDTDLIPEMQDLGKIDIAILPIGGTYTMNWQEAVKAVSWIKPNLAIPMHFGDIIGSDQDALNFKKNAGCKVEILKKL